MKKIYIMKRILSLMLVLLSVFGLCACSEKEITNTPKEDTLAFIEVNGEKIKDFNPKKIKYNVKIPNEILVKSEVYAENTNGQSENVKYKYPSTLKGIYMVKYNGTIYALNLEYDRQPNRFK